jgi:hypothetical protein
MRWQTSTLLGMGLGAAFGCGMVFLTHHLSTRGQATSRSPLDAGRKKSFDELRARLEADHASEPRNDSWAGRATDAYASDLREIAAAAGFRLVDLDCRSTTCLAQLSLHTCELARAAVHLVSRGPAPRYRYNCGVDVFVVGADAAECDLHVMFLCDGTIPDASEGRRTGTADAD